MSKNRTRTLSLHLGGSAGFENLVASHLLKWVHYQQDSGGEDIELGYFRDVDRREVDFIITRDRQPVYAIECKLKNSDPSRHLAYFKSKYPKVDAIQVHLYGDEEYISKGGINMLGWKPLLDQFL